ncbi:hypothetical protein B0H10DRAFT_2126112 [Mycena sp. CBHHK59/15]|nr:hypothetical protein B0H10DRAFT_2126112 [Mycena sp. CBHHK59/15]
MLTLSHQPLIRRAICKQIAKGMEGARADDTSTLKYRIGNWVMKDPKEEALHPALPVSKSKAHRGLAHPVFASYLTPIEWADNANTYLDITEGRKRLSGSQLPRCVFPIGQVFPLHQPLEDPAWTTVLENALKGEVVLRCAKAIFMGPESALEADGYHKGREANASIIGMTTFTPRTIAWVVVLVYFALSSKEEWNKTDRDFDYEEYFWTIYSLFDDKEASQEIIDLWNKVVLGAVVLQTPAPSTTGPSHLERLKAARAVSKHGAVATTPAEPAT